MAVEAGEDRTGIDVVVPWSLSGNQLFSAVGALSVSPLARPQDPAAPATGRVRGRVVSNDGRPLPYAQVVLTAPGMEARVGRADYAGAFEFPEVTAGTFRLGASKSGYFPLNAREPAAPVVDLAEDEKRDDLEITLRRWGTLAGRILDEHGDPMQGVGIQLLQVWVRRRATAARPGSRYDDGVGWSPRHGRLRRVSAVRRASRSVHCQRDDRRCLLNRCARLFTILFSRHTDTR